jgi:hypothetical protein
MSDLLPEDTLTGTAPSNVTFCVDAMRSAGIGK